MSRLLRHSPLYFTPFISILLFYCTSQFLSSFLNIQMSIVTTNRSATEPSTMQAFMTRFLRAPTIYTISVPKPEVGQLLVKVAYVSLNPTDCIVSSH